MTNKLMLANGDSQSLPFSIHNKKALVYLVQPYVDIDLFLVGGAASDGWGSLQSKIYIRSENGNFQYLGILNRYQPLCFYASPGQYEFKIDNGKYSKPEIIYKKIQLQANKYYFYAVEEKTYVFVNRYSFENLSFEKGKQYLYAGGRFNKGISYCSEMKEYYL